LSPLSDVLDDGGGSFSTGSDVGGQSGRLLDEDDLRLSLRVDGELQKNKNGRIGRKEEGKEKRSALFLFIGSSSHPLLRVQGDVRERRDRAGGDKNLPFPF